VALLSFVHAAFFHASARAIERETAQFDGKEATTSESPLDEKCANAQLSGSSSNNGEEEVVVDYHLIYGRVARSIDNSLTKYCDNGTFRSDNSGSNNRTMLSHLCWILFALCVGLGTMAVSSSITREDICKIPRPQPRPSLDTADYAPVENISGYPKELQKWITADHRFEIGPGGYG